MKRALVSLVAVAVMTLGAAARNHTGHVRSGAELSMLDVHRLPLGDGRVSRTPARGSVMTCGEPFRRGGPAHAGDWIDGGTWDLTAKPMVAGEVFWPNAEFAITTTGAGRVVSRVLRGNGLPVGVPTGTFPIARTNPARQFDPNPNGIAAQDVLLTLSTTPEPARSPSCVPMGMIGVALDGVAIYNALDAAGRDAVAHEVQDLCSGHPQGRGEYHYHGPSPCLKDQVGAETLIGYALDGYGIYSMYNANGREGFTNDNLDECHGRVSGIDWDGERVSLYHYVLTREYPYTVGCFTGSPVRPAGRR